MRPGAGMVALSLLLVALLSVPAVVAQIPELPLPEPATYMFERSVDDYGEVLLPFRETGTATATFTATCEQGSVHAPDHETLVTFSMSADQAWAVYEFEPRNLTLDFAPEECVSEPATRTVGINITFQFTDQAGYKDDVDLSLRADSDVANDTETWSETAGHYFFSEALFAKNAWQAGPGGEIDIPIRFANRGNADVTVTMTLGDGTSDRLQVTVPEPQTVPRFTDGTEIVLKVKAPAKDANDRQDDLYLVIQPALADDTSQTDREILLATIIQTNKLFGPGNSDESPLPAGVALLLLAAVLLAAARRFAQD